MSQLLQPRSINRELARVAIDTAVAASIERNCLTCIAVLDPSGHLVSYDRMDGAPFQSAQLAQDKAYSVAGNGKATHEFWQMIRDEAWLVHGVGKVEGLVFLGGGVPIYFEDELIGAIGVSGKSNMDEDRAIAEAAVDAVLERLSAVAVS
ncbi:GlcG/HbpS family heme-binding protein [Herbiconiux daphne]|uniref:Heme-binding protein n=1 Tax=Herbiconiux daphne TaxID=2970914 RepID=A0ABT2H534_9MICO|nr:heme-binding protein [Herbiconiux daphne]MCS5735019.1 heme-binding protein [Herbiconiux daphne]